MAKHDRSTASTYIMQIASGGSAGLAEICLMHPLDVIKTRFQVQSSVTGIQYTSIRHCFVTMYRAEGFLSFYKGILPPILAETPKRAIKFFTFERYKSLFTFDGTATKTTFVMAGLCSGLTEGLFINPFEVVKIRLQTDKQRFKEQKSAYATAREIVRTDGLGRAGMYRGLTSTLGRHGVWNMVYFGTYYSIKNQFPPTQDSYLDLSRRLLLGFFSGTLASIVNIPFDVAKTRIQGPQPVPGQVKYRTCLATMRTVYVEEGVLALYKGLIPKIMRLGPGGAIMLVVYETMFDFLCSVF